MLSIQITVTMTRIARFTLQGQHASERHRRPWIICRHRCEWRERCQKSLAINQRVLKEVLAHQLHEPISQKLLFCSYLKNLEVSSSLHMQGEGILMIGTYIGKSKFWSVLQSNWWSLSGFQTGNRTYQMKHFPNPLDLSHSFIRAFQEQTAGIQKAGKPRSRIVPNVCLWCFLFNL